ncbi:cytochrome c, partial [Candidatus Binatia bacterium]|nr:cytochrome c [Candidatus Binatia bacterium]
MAALVLTAGIGAAPVSVPAAPPKAALAPIAVATPTRQADDAGRLVFLLEYAGMDYENAVRDGNVVDQAEYGEVLRLLQELARGYGARKDRSVAVATAIAALQKDVERRAPAEQVFAASRKLLPRLIASVGGVPGPADPPNLASGRRLYETDCAPCHGETGAGDGPSSPGMTPPPTAFRGAFLERLAPRQIYNALTHGVPDTAMPSYHGAYDEQQRWDVAFFVPTLRVGFAPKPLPPGVSPSLDELASSSNAELLAYLQKRDAAATPEQVDQLRAGVGV